MELNYDPGADMAKGILRSWIQRKLSLIWEVDFIDTLVVSLFVYKIVVLAAIPDSFIWDGGKTKMAVKRCKHQNIQGGSDEFEVERSGSKDHLDLTNRLSDGADLLSLPKFCLLSEG